MRFVTATIAFVIAFITAHVEAAPPAQAPSVAVEGVLQVGEFFGPPNYGENPDSDSIEHSLFLQLPAPLAVQVEKFDSIFGLGREAFPPFFIQLVVFDTERPSAKKLIGKRVKVIGTLFEAETGHHRTPILLQVQSLSAVKEWRW